MNKQQRLCHDCGHELPSGASYCSNCGRQIRKRSERLEEEAERKQRRLAEHVLSNNGREAYDNYRKELALRAAKRNPLVWSLFLIFGLIALASYFLHLGIAVVVAFTVMAVLSLGFSINPDRWLSSPEYYSFPGSRFENGQHRCIFCGAKNIYWQGEYKTDNKYAQCSKCQSPLFAG
ncbi:zinc ribbon domain-containing protein [Limnohabitans sp. Jir72]|uniref:zinc ribbon domain-containing protein n=1 Tax=Limnohabitans sp. Jir72 TaxID=1977909 RepID=UPI000D3CAD1E|nr:zinc ribbon domain-containing protein [Limnohabitans sp. Jir72]